MNARETDKRKHFSGVYEGRRIVKLLRLVVRLARIHFLFLGFMLYLMGFFLAALRGIDVDLEKFAFGYLILGLAQLSVSFSNDYFDRHADKNSTKTAFSGGSKVLIEHPELKDLALKTAVFLLGMSTIGIAIFTFIYSYSYWFFFFGVFGGLIGWFYTAPPLKLAYRGIGEVVTMLAVGILIPGMGYFAASGLIDKFFLVFFFPLACYGLFFILTVELPDVESDTIAQKKNMLVKWGRKASTSISIIVTILGTLFLAAIHFSGIWEGKLDLKGILLLSFMPMIAAIHALHEGSKEKHCFDVRSAMINIISLILFICLVDFIFLLQFLE